MDSISNIFRKFYHPQNTLKKERTMINFNGYLEMDLLLRMVPYGEKIDGF
jgi:hypothetical protein